MTPKWITINNAYSTNWSAKQLHEYVKSVSCANRPASWHFSVDEKEVYQALPLNESGWHAGDNMGPGNTQSIGIEICDYAMLRTPKNELLFWQGVDHTAKLCAHLIKTVPSLYKFPACLKQHYDWSGKNCPSFIRAKAGGWAEFVSMVKKHIDGVVDPWPTYPIPRITRSIGVEVNGQRTDEVAYLINNATYVRVAYLQSLLDIAVTGHNDHIKVVTK
jgi:N-acetylmuramoyl-L-alanine amidase